MMQAQVETAGAGNAVGGKKVFVTLMGLPLSFSLEWPFHPSTSGADFWVLHGDIKLEGGEGMHARVAVNLSATVREVMASLEPKDAEVPVINALRTEVDRRQIELLKSGKLLPVAFSSRHYDFKRGKWVFGKASDDAIEEFLERKMYWQARLDGAAARVLIADPAEALYLATSTEHLIEVAARLAAHGLIELDKEWAVATPALMAQAEKYESAMQRGLHELETKHAFEHG
jgi:hypothetical protein